MLTGLSLDLFGQQLLSALKDSQVETGHVIVSPRPTTLAFVQLRNGQAHYTFFDENSAGRMLQALDMPELPAEVSTLYFGGISLVSEPAALAYASLCAKHQKHCVVMLDPNIRPDLITDEARYRRRLDAMMRQADIIKVSDDDLRWIQPGPPGLSKKVDRLIEKGSKLVILTQGDSGATAYLQDAAEVSVPAERVEIVDTVGAGDAFNAGVLAKLSEMGVLTKTALTTLSGDHARLALDFGSRIAAFTVARAGANPPWRDEI